MDLIAKGVNRKKVERPFYIRKGWCVWSFLSPLEFTTAFPGAIVTSGVWKLFVSRQEVHQVGRGHDAAYFLALVSA